MNQLTEEQFAEFCTLAIRYFQNPRCYLKGFLKDPKSSSSAGFHNGNFVWAMTIWDASECRMPKRWWHVKAKVVYSHRWNPEALIEALHAKVRRAVERIASGKCKQVGFEPPA